MNNRFKFRTWIPELNCYKYWGWVKENCYIGLPQCMEHSLDELLNNYTEQCTGAVDKEGACIYENDIVEGINPIYLMKSTFIVAFLEDYKQFVFVDTKTGNSVDFIDLSDIKVVGNLIQGGNNG